MKTSVKKLLRMIGAGLLASLFSVLICSSVSADTKNVRILFTHDMHSYMDTKKGIVDGINREFGNIAKLSTLIKQEKDKNSIYVDAGDIAMGTLYQAGFSTDAYELRMLGLVGCDVVTFGNHEFDYGCLGVKGELEAAVKSGDPLPKLVESSFNFEGTLTDEQAAMKKALEDYGWTDYTIEEINGVKIGIFGIEGPDSIECIQSDVNFYDYIEVANRMVAELRNKCDIVMCLSHTGTSGDGEKGEDFDMLKKVKGIDIVISGHSHSAYKTPVVKNGTILVSAGSYLQNVGELDVSIGATGQVTVMDYRLIPLDENIEEDAEIREKLDEFKKTIKETYLAKYAEDGNYDDVLSRSDYTLLSVDEMYATYEEYPMGNIIADSYLYAARKNNINDIDVALVGLGTIRGSITQGYVTLSDAFEICSLGVGSDGSAGHPLLCAYITGEELKLMCELDASLGPMVSSIKMSYAGLNFTYNSKRAILDRVTDVVLVREDGTKESIKDDQLYKVCCNMYAANMLGMLNGLTAGTLSIVPKYADGTPVTDFYDVTVNDINGIEIKEWVALKDYLKSFSGVKIPADLLKPQGRKLDINQGGFIVLKNPGLTTWLFSMLVMVGLVLIAIFGVKGVKRAKIVHDAKKAGLPIPETKHQQKKKKRKAKRAVKKAKHAAKKANRGSKKK